jgi:hypothetical protein
MSPIFQKWSFSPKLTKLLDNVIQKCIKQNGKWLFGLKYANGRILTQTDFVDKMEKWNGKKGTPHFLIQESDKSMGLRITTRKDS